MDGFGVVAFLGKPIINRVTQWKPSQTLVPSEMQDSIRHLWKGITE